MLIRNTILGVKNPSGVNPAGVLLYYIFTWVFTQVPFKLCGNFWSFEISSVLYYFYEYLLDLLLPN